MKQHIDNCLRILKAVALRNHIILCDFSNQARRHHVNLHWWKLNGSKQNIGDRLSPVVVEYLLNKYNISDNVLQGGTKHLYAIGSIVDGGYQDATVWGSGVLRGQSTYWWKYLRKLDIRSIRGPETRRVLLDNGFQCPEIYGDPAILMPLIYSPQDQDKHYEYRVVPHMIYGSRYPNYLSPFTENWHTFIDEIVKSRLVISSSLHGIILAEAYGVPAILLNDHDMNLFKYKDYYYSTGRYTFPVAKSVEEALSLEPAEIPNFEDMQRKLIEVFPVDLWK